MSLRKPYLATLALIEWFGIIAQLILMLDSGAAPTGELLIRFSTYFTITTNLLVGIYTVVLLARPAHPFFSHPSTQTAIVVYITVVGLIYNLILRQLWSPAGLQAVVDDILHTAVPLLVIFYWIIWVDARSVRPQAIWRWLLYPAAYTVIVFVRGSFANWYPYPFLDVRRLSTAIVIRNCMGVLGVFLLFSVIYRYWGIKKGDGGSNKRSLLH